MDPDLDFDDLNPLPSAHTDLGDGLFGCLLWVLIIAGIVAVVRACT